MNANDIITYWFKTLKPKDWFVKNTELDAYIRRNYSIIHASIEKDEQAHWRESDAGRLAEIIVLDQFSRNMFRGKAEAFAFDEQALALSKAAIDAGSHMRLTQVEINFLLMPFMHSESLAEHQAARPLFEQYASPGTLDFEHKHCKIIEQFGRYPHRNKILDRISSREETQFLTKAGSSF
ncbi:MAG: DUF924 family protein [Arenicellales bacterium]